MLDDVSEAPDNNVDTDPQSSKSMRAARSEIAFPYASLEDALTVVQTVADGGGDLTRDQTSAKLALPGSTFNVRVGAARMFGLVRAEGGSLRLTQDRCKIVSADSNETAIARRDAFLNVILYRKTFDAYKGRSLPDAEGLEDHFRRLGVAPKQADKARLAFERSALFSGFFHAGKTRLVEPIIVAAQLGIRADKEDDAASALSAKGASVEKPIQTAAQQHLIVGLLERLPPPDTAWSIAERVRWLRALAVNLGVLYGPNDDGEISIAIPPRRQVVENVKAPPPKVPSPTQAVAKAETSGGWEPSGNDLDDEIPF